MCKNSIARLVSPQTGLRMFLLFVDGKAMEIKMTNSNQNNTKSLFLYTALIFIVAILLIMISFFGDAKITKNLPTPSPNATTAPDGITEKAAALSQENLRLTQEVASLKAQMEKDKNNLDVYVALAEAAYYKEQGDTKKTEEILLAIDPETLDEKQKALYNNIKEN